MLRRTFLQLCASFLAIFGIGIDTAEAHPYLSTKINVLVDGKVIGTIDTLNIEEERDLVTHRKTISASAGRIRFNRMRISEAFSRGYVHAKAQRKPLQIEVSDNIKSGGRVTTHIQNCWIERMGNTHYRDAGSGYLISKDVRMQAEDIWSDLNG